MTVLLLTSSFFMFFMLYIGMKMWSTVFYMINLLTKKTFSKKTKKRNAYRLLLLFFPLIFTSSNIEESSTVSLRVHSKVKCTSLYIHNPTRALKCQK